MNTNTKLAAARHSSYLVVGIEEIMDPETGAACFYVTFGSFKPGACIRTDDDARVAALGDNDFADREAAECAATDARRRLTDAGVIVIELWRRESFHPVNVKENP